MPFQPRSVVSSRPLTPTVCVYSTQDHLLCIFLSLSFFHSNNLHLNRHQFAEDFSHRGAAANRPLRLGLHPPRSGLSRSRRDHFPPGFWSIDRSRHGFWCRNKRCVCVHFMPSSTESAPIYLYESCRTSHGDNPPFHTIRFALIIAYPYIGRWGCATPSYSVLFHSLSFVLTTGSVNSRIGKREFVELSTWSAVSLAVVASSSVRLWTTKTQATRPFGNVSM